MQVREVVYLGSIQCLIQAEGRGEAQLEGLQNEDRNSTKERERT